MMQKKLTDKPQSNKATDASAPEASPYTIGDPGAFAQNMVRVGMQSQRLVADFVKRQAAKAGSEPLDPLNLTGTFSSFLRAMAENPAQMVEAQFELWHNFLGLWESTARRMLGGENAPVVQPKAGDKRFKDKDWQENQIFDFIKQSYLLTANWI